MNNETVTKANRLAWVEPSVEMMSVRETAQNPGKGGDLEYTSGGNRYPDCTRS